MYTDGSFAEVIDGFASLIADSPSDPRAGTWVSWVHYQGMDLALTELWYTEPNGQNATIFDKFNRLTPISDDTQNLTLAEYTQKVNGPDFQGFRQAYSCITTKASVGVLEAAKDIFFKEIQPVLSLEGSLPVMIWQAITLGKKNQRPQFYA